MNLEEPPIVEAWIELRLDASDHERTWPDNINRFMQDLPDDLSDRQYRIADQVELKKVDPVSGVPQEVRQIRTIDRVRAFDKGHTRCVQAGQNLFVYNLPQRGKDYKGFEYLIKEALAHFEIYRNCFRPRMIRTAILHYTDMISVPAGASAGLNLDEYFRLGVKVPNESEWPLEAFGTNLLIPLKSRTGSNDRLVVEFASGEPDLQTRHLRFVLTWHWIAEQVDSLDPVRLAERLRMLHSQAQHYFRQAIMDRLWRLFKPRLT